MRESASGLTVVRLLRREDYRLFVQGLYFYDGTPVLDVKDYRPQYRAENYTLPEWFRKLADEKGYV